MNRDASGDSENSCIIRDVTAGRSHKTACGLSNGASHKNIRLSIRGYGASRRFLWFIRWAAVGKWLGMVGGQTRRCYSKKGHFSEVL